MRASTLLCSLLAWYAVWAAAPALAQTRMWRADERVLISSFSHVGALALDTRRVYAATPNGLEIYDFVARRWELPSTAEDGYPAGEGPTALVYDRWSDALWLATSAGSLYAYTLAFQRWERRGMLGAPTERIIIVDDEPGTLFFAGPYGWRMSRSGGAFEEPVAASQLPASVQRAAAQSGARLAQTDPYFGAARATMTRDARLRHWPLTDVAPAEARGQFWLATAGGNIALFDGRTLRTDWLPYGLTGTGVGAVAQRGDTVWFGGDGRDARSGVSHADRELQSWRSHERMNEGAPGGWVYDIQHDAEGVWFAASDGLYLWNGAGWHSFGAAEGIPASPILAVTASHDGVWVSARGGLAHLARDRSVRRAFDGVATYRAVEHAGNVWVATERGLWRVGARDADAAGAAVLAGRVIDVSAAFGSVFALAEDALYRIDATGAQTTIREPAQRLGRLYTLATAGERLFVGGQRGVASWHEGTRAWAYYAVPQDVPAGPVRDIAVDGAQLWLATPAGALRIPAL